MKFNELRTCDFCGKAVSGNTRDQARYGKSMDFHRLVVEHLILNVSAIQERAGLTMMLGGSETLAEVMGTGKDAAIPVSRRELLVCSPCWYEKFDPLHELGERGKEPPTPEADRALERARR